MNYYDRSIRNVRVGNINYNAFDLAERIGGKLKNMPDPDGGDAASLLTARALTDCRPDRGDRSPEQNFSNAKHWVEEAISRGYLAGLQEGINRERARLARVLALQPVTVRQDNI